MRVVGHEKRPLYVPSKPKIRLYEIDITGDGMDFHTLHVRQHPEVPKQDMKPVLGIQHVQIQPLLLVRTWREVVHAATIYVAHATAANPSLLARPSITSTAAIILSKLVLEAEKERNGNFTIPQSYKEMME